jgi:hypothetical protein
MWLSMKNNKVKELLEKRKIGHTAKDSKIGETIYQCVLFKRMAKITEISTLISVEFPFGEFARQRFSTIKEFELYLDSGK